MSNTLATAAITPFVGAISDLVGRRWVALSGLVLVMVGTLVIGLAQTNAVVGIGSGLAEMIGFAGAVEAVPVKSRGKVIGLLFILYIPIAGGATFGTSPLDVVNFSPIILSEYMEMGCLD